MRLQVSSQVTFLAALLRTLSRNPVPILGTRIRTQNGDVIFKFISHVPVLGTRSGTQNRDMNLTIYVQTAIFFATGWGRNRNLAVPTQIGCLPLHLRARLCVSVTVLARQIISPRRPPLATETSLQPNPHETCVSYFLKPVFALKRVPALGTQKRTLRKKTKRETNTRTFICSAQDPCAFLARSLRILMDLWRICSGLSKRSAWTPLAFLAASLGMPRDPSGSLEYLQWPE